WSSAPSALIESAFTLICLSSASIFKVRLFGAGPGLYFDFSAFSFHVPEWASAASAMLPAKVASKATPTKTARDLVLIVAPPQAGVAGASLIAPLRPNVQQFLDDSTQSSYCLSNYHHVV